MLVFRAIILPIVALLLFFALHHRIEPLPPLGAFLNPFSGYLQNGEDAPLPEVLDLASLHDEVTVVWDERRVPHIFAQNDHDLYFTQGYLTARHRLWQMEIQIMAAAGRLAEILGPPMIEHDRFQRRLGIPAAAKLAAKAMEEVETTRPVVQAYSAGVNAFIASLDYEDLPLEYKLLDYWPEQWSPYKSALLLKQMAWDLTSYNMNELNLTRVREVFDQEDVDRLYPVRPPYTDPIIPTGTEWPFAAPGFSQKGSAIIDAVLGMPLPESERDSRKNIALGSNNWAIAGARTASGSPILCNDPHLGLTLPAVWYETQLHTPTINVCGVTPPGAPGIVIGFNEQIAWGLTNAETDVIDLVNVDFEADSTILQWRADTILVRDDDPVVDTTLFTEAGPLPSGLAFTQLDRRIPPGVALSWTGADASNELLTFLQLNRATNYDDYIAALQHYDAPAQNFAFAGEAGDIAISHNGKIPIRREGEGRFVSDHELGRYGYIPREHLPQIKNPSRGFVSSANQHPVDTLYPYYLSGTHYTFERGARINEVLDTLTAATTEDMMILQTDLLNIQARKVLPTLLSLIELDSLSALERKLFDELSDWDFHELAEMRMPAVYHEWWRSLGHMIWDDEMRSAWGQLDPPHRGVTTQLILESPESQFFDDVRSSESETLAELVNRSFHAAVSTLHSEFGEPNNLWRWGNYRGTDIKHLAALPALSRLALPVGGSGATIAASSRVHGVSWRMIVELTDPPQAWGIYPGGQSGNPGSQFYDNQIDNWLAGDYYQLHLLTGSDTSSAGYFRTTTMRGGR